MTPETAFFVTWRLGAVGGMERHLCDLATALTREGARVTVFVEQPLAPDNRYARALRAAGVAIIAPSLATRSAMRIERSWPYRRATAWRRESPATFALLRALDRHARRTPPDVVHVHGCRLAQRYVLTWAKARDLPAAYTEHVTIDDWQGPHDASSPAVFDQAGAAIACVSEHARDSLGRHLRSRIALAPHIVPDPAVPPMQATRVGPLRLLSIGRLDACKGHHVLLQAAAILRDGGASFTLTIAGDGEERTALERRCRELNLEHEVTFAGLVDQDVVSGLWAEADLGVLPSLTEGLPIALLEAMAAGRPVVASDTGGIAELLTDGVEGFLVPPGDAAALAGAIAGAADQDRLAEMGRSARSRFEGGSWSARDAVEQAGRLYDTAATLRSTGNPQAVRICVYQLATAGEMERRVARQAIALAEAGVAVALHVERPVRPLNPYCRQMQRAGVRVIAPGVAGWLAARCWAAATRGTGGLPAVLARAVDRDRPAAVHVHGWRLGTGWRALDKIAALLNAGKVTAVFEEHDSSISGSSGSPAVRSFDTLVAASPAASAAIAKVLDGQHPPIAVLSALDEPPWAPPPQAMPEGNIRVFALVDQSAREQLTAMAGRVELVDDAIVADMVVLTPARDGYAIALGRAMAAFKPIILTARDRNDAIRDGITGLIADDLMAAIDMLRADPLLASQFATAARRVYSAGGHDRPLIAAELIPLYQRSRAAGRSDAGHMIAAIKTSADATA